jgi:hypothetical protein
MASVAMTKASIRIIQANYNAPLVPGGLTVFQDIINTMQSIGVTRLAIYQAQDFTSTGQTGQVFCIEGLMTAANYATLVTHFSGWQTSLGTTLDVDSVVVQQGW